MDLYGYNPGTASANESRNRVAQGNQAVLEFNKGLDAQVDTLKLEGAANSEQLLSDRNTKLGTVSANAAAKFGLKSVAGPAKAAKAAETLKASKLAETTFVPSKAGVFSRAVANPLSRVGPEVVNVETGAVRGGGAIVESSADLAVAGGETAAKVGLSAAEAAGTLAKGLGVVGGVATLGIESYKLAEGKTKFKDENGWQQAGQIASIAGGGLQILGAITAWTGFGLGVEAAGTALTLAGTAAEEIGDEDAADKKQADDIGDVTKQKRAFAVAQTSGVEVARSD